MWGIFVCVSVYAHSDILLVFQWEVGGYQPKYICQEKSILLGIVLVEVMGEWESFKDMVVF